MIQVLTAVGDGYCGNDQCASFQFEIPSKDFDLIGAIQKASADYVMTKDGLEAWHNKNELFNLQDFFECVPNKFCEKYGFQKIYIPKESVWVDFDEQMIDDGQFPFNRIEPGIVTSYLNYLITDATKEEVEKFIGRKLTDNESIKNAVGDAYQEMDEDKLEDLAEEWF